MVFRQAATQIPVVSTRSRTGTATLGAFALMFVEEVFAQPDGPEPTTLPSALLCPTAEADKQLRLWYALKHAAYFFDAGVLDNKPFTYTIRDIAYRLKDREIERFLLIRRAPSRRVRG